jgi:hypothetical protein
LETEAARSPRSTLSVPDAAPLLGWTRHALYRAIRKGRIKFVRGPPGPNGLPTLHLSAAEFRRLAAMQEGRGPRKRTTPLIVERRR